LEHVQPSSNSDTFNHRLRHCATLTEQRLEQWLSASDPGQAVPGRLNDAMRYAALGGGKRLRPFLVMEGARLCGVPDEASLNTAAAFECVHCYSLVHDDLPAMDDDDMRRGRPTVHKAYDEATAILAGDALQTLAFEILADPTTHADAAVRSALCLALARASGAAGMAGGQMLDLEAATKSLDETAILRLQAMKTGALIRLACEAGAILAKADTSRRDALAAYGTMLGQAFQLADDLLDVEGDAALLGKAVAKDNGAGKATLVSLIGVDQARKRLAAMVTGACRLLEPFGADAATLITAAYFVAERRH
jgi:farnesyl diphosphate synthase